MCTSEEAVEFLAGKIDREGQEIHRDIEKRQFRGAELGLKGKKHVQGYSILRPWRPLSQEDFFWNGGGRRWCGANTRGGRYFLKYPRRGDK